LNSNNTSGKIANVLKIIALVSLVILIEVWSEGQINDGNILMILSVFAGSFLGIAFVVFIIFGIKSILNSLFGKEKAPRRKLDISRFSRDAGEEKWTGPSMKTSDSICSEHLAEDCFEHDRQLRLKQLDVFLKNGLIDKKEYATLRQRYEKL